MSKHRGPEDTSRSVRGDAPPSGTAAGADVTRHMSGVHSDETSRREHARDDSMRDDHGRDELLERDRVRDDRLGRDEHVGRDDRHGRDEYRDRDHVRDDRHERDHVRDEHLETVRPTDRTHGIKPAKTSAAAVFGLVFGLAALFCALTAILSPAAILFGLIGLVLALIGLKMSKRPGVTGRGVAIGGLVTALLGLLLGAAVLAGAAVVVNDEQRLNQLENWIEDVRNDLPTTEQIQSEIPG